MDGEAGDLDRGRHSAISADLTGDGYEDKSRERATSVYIRAQMDKVDRWILFLSQTSWRPARPGPELPHAAYVRASH